MTFQNEWQLLLTCNYKVYQVVTRRLLNIMKCIFSCWENEGILDNCLFLFCASSRSWTQNVLWLLSGCLAEILCRVVSGCVLFSGISSKSKHYLHLKSIPRHSPIELLPGSSFLWYWRLETRNDLLSMIYEDTPNN